MKAFDTLVVALPSNAPRESTTVLSTVSSDGRIHLYDLSELPPNLFEAERKDAIDIVPIAEFDAKGTRFTCVTLADGDLDTVSSDEKRKREESEEFKGISDSDDRAKSKKRK